MRSVLTALGLVGLSSMAAPAMAIITADTTIDDVTLDFGPAPPLEEMVKNNGAPDGTTLLLATNPSDIGVQYTAPTTLEASGSGDGFAFVSGPGNGGSEQGFASLTISLADAAEGFTDINFNLFPLGTGNNTFYGDITLNRLDGGSPITFSDVAFDTAGQNKFSIYSATDIKFSSITFSGLATAADNGTAVNFGSIRQVSIDTNGGGGVTPIPEASSWAMMIIGFGALGGAQRLRTRKRIAAC